MEAPRISPAPPASPRPARSPPATAARSRITRPTSCATASAAGSRRSRPATKRPSPSCRPRSSHVARPSPRGRCPAVPPAMRLSGLPAALVAGRPYTVGLEPDRRRRTGGRARHDQRVRPHRTAAGRRRYESARGLRQEFTRRPARLALPRQRDLSRARLRAHARPTTLPVDPPRLRRRRLRAPRDRAAHAAPALPRRAGCGCAALRWTGWNARHGHRTRARGVARRSRSRARASAGRSAASSTPAPGSSRRSARTRACRSRARSPERVMLVPPLGGCSPSARGATIRPRMKNKSQPRPSVTSASPQRDLVALSLLLRG